jgi:hypothetical protein
MNNSRWREEELSVGKDYKIIAIDLMRSVNGDYISVCIEKDGQRYGATDFQHKGESIKEWEQRIIDKCLTKSLTKTL